MDRGFGDGAWVVRSSRDSGVVTVPIDGNGASSDRFTRALWEMLVHVGSGLITRQGYPYLWDE